MNTQELQRQITRIGSEIVSAIENPATPEDEKEDLHLACIRLLEASLALNRVKSHPSKLDEATKWLANRLASGNPIASASIIVEAKAAGIAIRTLHRARKELGVEHNRTVDGTTWRLSKKYSTNAILQK